MEWIIQPLNLYNGIFVSDLNECPAAFSTTSCAWYSECNGTGRMIIVTT